MVTGNGGASSFAAPAVLWLVDSSETGLVLKHQSNLAYTSAQRKRMFFFSERCFNFFEASIASGDDFLGCSLRGLTLRQL